MSGANTKMSLAALTFMLAGAGPASCDDKPVYFLRCSSPGAAPYYAEVSDMDGLGAERVEAYKDVLIGERSAGNGVTCAISDNPPTLVGNPD